MIKDVAEDFPAVFIRAPHIVEAGEEVEILSSIMAVLWQRVKDNSLAVPSIQN